MSKLNPNLQCNPNVNYNRVEQVLEIVKNKHLPEKTVKFQKYKHKNSSWITNGILRSLKFRDTLYRTLKCTSLDDPQYYILKQNLKTFNKILTKNINELKRDHYHAEFERFKHNTKKALGYH